ncbi:hypothetical protein ACHAPT_007278 [Fusarium lateritium]
MAEPEGAFSRLKAAMKGVPVPDSEVITFAKDTVAALKGDKDGDIVQQTARQLAALFEDLCPDTPNLVRAYGERVSEIFKCTTDERSKGHPASLVAALTGGGATSVAAALAPVQTTRRSVIHVHLLACILTSMWGLSKSIDIWGKIVSDRRTQIASDVARGVALLSSTAADAAQEDISDTQLLDWAFATFSWINMANNIMAREKEQLGLILENRALVAEMKPSPHRSLIGAWLSALTAMENLVSGRPQEVQDGFILNAISAWHLYPDVYVFGPANAEAHMRDRLVPPQGVVIIGCDPGARVRSNGMLQSLPRSQV